MFYKIFYLSELGRKARTCGEKQRLGTNVRTGGGRRNRNRTTFSTWNGFKKLFVGFKETVLSRFLVLENLPVLNVSVSSPESDLIRSAPVRVFEGSQHFDGARISSGCRNTQLTVFRILSEKKLRLKTDVVFFLIISLIKSFRL